ncbi:MAG: glycosyltransferase [Actinomycetota bacterium]|nr:glycosyltransferase [Actinomycetota bacterium]
MQYRMIKSVLGVQLPTHCIIRYPFIDVSRFKPLGLRRDIDVLYVGTISEAKGYRNLVERFDTSRLVFAGRHELNEPVVGTYLGELPYRELPELYNRARIFAHLPQWYEPMGRTVIEAALCGCDVVTNERVGVTSFPRREWIDPTVVRGNADRFWADVERAVGDLG